MSTRKPTLRVTLAALGVGVFSSNAVAQQEYDLGEDDSWTLTSEPVPGSPEGQLAEIRRALAEGTPGRASSEATAWIEQFPNHPFLPQAYLMRGDALAAQESYYEALFDYEYIAAVFAGSDVFVTALQRELGIATRFARGTRRKLWGMRIVDASSEAEELLILIQERLPGSALAEKAGMELGDFYFRNGDMSLATVAYDLYIDNYPDSAELSKARRRLIAAYLASSKGPEFDATGLYEARHHLGILQRREPAAAEEIGATALLAGIDERDAAKMLETGSWYLKSNDPIGAAFTLRRLLRVYPRSHAAGEAMKLMAKIVPKLPQSVRDRMPTEALPASSGAGETSPTDSAAAGSDASAAGNDAATGEDGR